jgi:predicted transposase YbfD/YdcC
LRHSFDNFTDRKAAHILGAFATGPALVLGHIECDEKSNEIPAVQTMLAELGIKGAIVTADAMHCQKTFEAAARAGAQLITQVKANQPALHDVIVALCAGARPHDQTKTIDAKKRLRHETRTADVFLPGDALAGSEWAGHVASIIRVHRETMKRDLTTGLWSTVRETSYYAANTVIGAGAAAQSIREHWGIENRLHYVKDMAFAEDASRIRVNPGIFARLRSFAVNVLRFNKAGNIANTRYRLAIGGIDALLELQFM